MVSTTKIMLRELSSELMGVSGALEARREVLVRSTVQLGEATKSWGEVPADNVSAKGIETLHTLRDASYAVGAATDLLEAQTLELQHEAHLLSESLRKTLQNMAKSYIDMVNLMGGLGFDHLIKPEMYGLHPDTPGTLGGLFKWSNTRVKDSKPIDLYLKDLLRDLEAKGGECDLER